MNNKIIKWYLISHKGICKVWVLSTQKVATVSPTSLSNSIDPEIPFEPQNSII